MNQNDMISLIDKAKRRTGMNEQELSVYMGYHLGHVAQVKSRGIISKKFIRSINKLIESWDKESEAEYNGTTNKFPDKYDSLVMESKSEYGNNTHDLILIISRLSSTIESQQITIEKLAIRK